MKKPVLAIVGGGASGLIGGIFAAKILGEKGKVIILERMDRVGKKILATGNGRCNFTNLNTSVYNFYGKNPNFVEFALKQFSVFDTLDFFQKIGIYPKEEDNGKMYPYSEQASSVLDCLRNEVSNLGIEIISGFEVKEITQIGKKFKITSFSGNVLNSEKVIVSAGGCASPNLGSNGSGFKILKNLGHTITKLNPALVQLKTEKDIVKGLKGIKFTGNVKIISGKKVLKEEFGEVLFTDYGLSGPPIFQLSTISAMKNGCSIVLDFMPELSKKEIFDLLSERKKNLNHLTMENFFVGLLNKKIGNVIAKKSGIEKLSFSVSNLSKDLLWNMANLIKEFEFKIVGQNGWNNAQVTAGGASTDEFDFKTMQSKIVQGLFASGEVLDIFGDCGGFNLQWAWSSGVLAGKSAAMAILNDC